MEKIETSIKLVLVSILLILFTIIFTLFIGVLKVDAKTLSLNDNQFAFTWGTWNSVPTPWAGLSAGASSKLELHVMKIYDPDTDLLEGYNYIVMEFCTGSINTIRDAYISNTNYNTDFINDGTGQTYVTTNTCMYDTYPGTIVKKQFQVGRWTDDGDGVAYARAYLNITNNNTWWHFYRLNNIYLSDTDELSSLAENQQSTQDIIDSIEDKANDVIQSQKEVQEAIIANNNANTDKITDSVDKNTEAIDKNTEEQKETNDFLKDDSPPDLSAFNDYAGWLPPGPLDSILNLPLTLLNNLTNLFDKSCQGTTIPLPYVDGEIDLPCVSTIYSKIEGLDTIINTLCIPIIGYILFKYFMNLYNWVDKTLTFRENNWIDNWGGV